MKLLSEMRKDAGFRTQAELAEKLETERVNIARWETGIRYPRPQMLVKLAGALCVTEGEVIAAIAAAKEAHENSA